jgi:hypothetical protein
MKKLLAAMGLAAAAAWTALPPAGAGQAQQSSGKPESFTIPIAQPGQNAAPPAYLPLLPGVQQMPPPPQAATAFGQPAVNATKASFLSQLQTQDFDEPDPNQDIAVKPECGTWMICVNTYTGPDASKEARAMVMELRNNPQYKLNAYVFTKGAEERKAELKRMAKAKEDQIKRLATIPDLPPDTQISIPLIHSNLEIQYAVLVGGYKDQDSAKRAIESLKKLKPPDPNKVKMDTQYVIKVDDNGKAERKDVLINPFAFALPVLNPSVPAKIANGSSAEDLALLRELNATEQFSLLKCPKKFTLVVKYFEVPMSIQPMNGSKSVMDRHPASSGKPDAASGKAQVLAALLRREKLEAYVLHTKYISYVSVGSYDSPDDPRLLRDQERLPQFMAKALEKISPQLIEEIKLLARPAIMGVPN